MMHFDTLKAHSQLTSSGFTDEQARAVVTTFSEHMNENLATKDDIAAAVASLATRDDLNDLRTDTKADIAAVKADLNDLRKETHAEFRLVRAEIQQMGDKLTIRLGLMMAAAVGLLLGLSRLLDMLPATPG